MAFKYKFFHWASSLSILRESRKELEIGREGNREEKIVGIRTGSRNTAGEEEKDRRKERRMKNRRTEESKGIFVRLPLLCSRRAQVSCAAVM